MSGRYPTTDPFLATYGILLIVAVGVVILGIGGVAYFFLFPEIRTIPKTPQTMVNQANQNSSSYESVLKTLNEDESKVLTVLKKHNGKYLDLTRLRTRDCINNDGLFTDESIQDAGAYIRDLCGIMAISNSGGHEGTGFWLCEELNWELITECDGRLFLVPTKK